MQNTNYLIKRTDRNYFSYQSKFNVRSTDYVLWEDTYDSLSIGDEVTFSDATKGHKFTLEVVSFKLTPQTASIVSALNTDNSCGYSDWTLNTAKDLTGKTCSSTA